MADVTRAGVDPAARWAGRCRVLRLGQSGALPWERRPKSAEVLVALRNPRRGFEAVVIGKPHRMFYGNQFGLIFPLFVHYGVELWVPEVGGRVDPNSDAHDMMLLLFGGLSKAERNRIKVRVRAAMAAQAATEGRFLGGRPPYGYRLVDVGPHPNPSKAADGRMLRQLAPDPRLRRSCSVPRVRIGRRLVRIAEGLTREDIPCPSAHDRTRNRHREGAAWAKSAVRAILTNPRYTGRQVWNRQRRVEVLMDVEDVALGHETKMRWNDEDAWVRSADLVHEPIVSEEEFGEVQERMATTARRSADRRPRTTDRPYVLRSLIFCGMCNRRMQGTWNHGRPLDELEVGAEALKSASRRARRAPLDAACVRLVDPASFGEFGLGEAVLLAQLHEPDARGHSLLENLAFLACLACLGCELGATVGDAVAVAPEHRRTSVRRGWGIPHILVNLDPAAGVLLNWRAAEVRFGPTACLRRAIIVPLSPMPSRTWEVEFYPACERWADDLPQADKEALLAAIRVLRSDGPTLGRPLVDTIVGSRHSNMKELRPGSTGRTEIRVLLAFDIERRAILLVGGDKSDDWSGWYVINIPIADDRFDEHQTKLRAKGKATKAAKKTEDKGRR